jgi:outer membrane scaffolding protein for murein synthesis (MipA/OmpV family)
LIGFAHVENALKRGENDNSSSISLQNYIFKSSTLMKILLRTLFCWGTCFALSSLAQVFAQNQLTNDDVPSEKKSISLDVTLGWSQSNLSLSNGVLTDTQLLPTLNVNFENQMGFLSLQNGFGLWLFKSSELKLGASVNYMLGRFERFDRRYHALGDVSGSFDAYTWFEWQPIKDAITAYANYARTPGATYRTYSQIGLTLGLPISENKNIFADINFNYANEAYWQKYYGIDVRQASISARAPYTMSQGGMLNSVNLIGLDVVIGSESDLILGVGQLNYSRGLTSSPLIVQPHQRTLLLVLNQKLNH